MASIIETVDQRTNLVGQNRLELLLFNLNGAQIFGINVFKVCEVIRTPKLIRMPHAHPAVAGVAHIRGKTIAVLDLSLATTGKPVDSSGETSIIVTEYNRTTQGFVVRGVDRIVNLNWQDIMPPPSGASGSAYLTGVTRVDDRLVQIVDVEKVMAEVTRAERVAAASEQESRDDAIDRHVLVVDDSVVARKQVRDTLQQIGVQVSLAKNGEEALAMLDQWAGAPAGTPLESMLMVISDIEMPRMDGYTLTSEIRKRDNLKHLHVLLHTSLSGVFNGNMVKRVGADDFLAKFAADELSKKVTERLDAA
ncbi:two-component system chemotaxis response regulator CheV [Natronocella acetinitrilica]|uniref:Two-component system chemotaxis response regulator CheV n=1 Tax=Natronocella acetinitrilica TaxID=414046 RepID=A0AAE3G6G7_9GAMM|nr:chemotaxis protein [Natronocella acetinitrilica]MCP1675626.1 two-component system chemotaxis response regulator CheV [Natronocella acetinitrilica]